MDKPFIIRVAKTWVRTALIVAVTALIVAPLAAVASHSFTDVPDTNTFHTDIEWLKDSGVTKGCNPPANTLFCPDDEVTREQMAAFMRRLAQYLDAEDGTPAQADNADTLDGQHASAFLGKTEQARDADKLDGKDSAVFVEGSQLLAVHAGGEQNETVADTFEAVRSVSLTAPVDGTVIVNSTLQATDNDAGDGLNCSITTGTTLEGAFVQIWQSGGTLDGAHAQVAATRGFDVTAGQNITINLNCIHFGGGASTEVRDSVLTGIFVPNP